MGSHSRNQQRAVHALERHGWRVRESDENSWLLESVWAPVGVKISLLAENNRLLHEQGTHSGGILKLGSRFEHDLPSFLSYLNRVRQTSRFFPDGEFSVGGVTLEMSEAEVRRIHGKPTDESVFYVQDHHPELGVREYERIQHTYRNVTVTFYHSAAELQVCRVYGSTLELDGRYYLNAGEPQSRLDELFEPLPWEKRTQHFSPPGWANWWYYGPSVYIDRFGEVREFRLGDHEGPFGRMMAADGD